MTHIIRQHTYHLLSISITVTQQASKTLQGEMYRVLEMNQLLATVEKAAESLVRGNRRPAIIITVRQSNLDLFLYDDVTMY